MAKTSRPPGSVGNERHRSNENPSDRAAKKKRTSYWRDYQAKRRSALRARLGEAVYRRARREEKREERAAEAGPLFVGYPDGTYRWTKPVNSRGTRLIVPSRLRLRRHQMAALGFQIGEQIPNDLTKLIKPSKAVTDSESALALDSYMAIELQAHAVGIAMYIWSAIHELGQRWDQSAKDRRERHGLRWQIKVWKAGIESHFHMAIHSPLEFLFAIADAEVNYTPVKIVVVPEISPAATSALKEYLDWMIAIGRAVSSQFLMCRTVLPNYEERIKQLFAKYKYRGLLKAVEVPAMSDASIPWVMRDFQDPSSA